MSDLEAILEEREKTHEVRYKNIEKGLNDINTFITSQNETVVAQGKDIARLQGSSKLSSKVAWFSLVISTGLSAIFAYVKGQS